VLIARQEIKNLQEGNDLCELASSLLHPLLLARSESKSLATIEYMWKGRGAKRCITITKPAIDRVVGTFLK
jgi:hypothetical protein